MLVLPMLDLENEVIGILKLINSIDPKSGEIIEFSSNQVDIAHSLAIFDRVELIEMCIKCIRNASKRIKINGRDVSLINEDEFKMLSVRKGSITPDELHIMRNHASVTVKMLSKIPFTRKLKNVPVYAGGHHEKLNGSGYPLCLKAEQIPLQTRIIALTDFFEALVAKDRPYKKPIPLDKALEIMEAAVKDVEIKVALLESGADDYITKPFDFNELSARIQSLMRRTGNKARDASNLFMNGAIARQTGFVHWHRRQLCQSRYTPRNDIFRFIYMYH